MAVLFESWLSESVFVVSLLFFLHYLYFKLVTSQHWRRKNVAHLEPVYLLGNTWNASLTDNFSFLLADIHRKWKNKKLVGFWNFTRPILLITDLNIIKNVLICDFNYFRDRRRDFEVSHDPLSGHLFNLGGAKWRNLRVKLTPTFTSGKMKMMFPTMVKCGEELQNYLETTPEVQKGVEVKEILSRFTTDIISSCAFGIETNSLKNPDSEFRRYGKKIFTPTFVGLFKRIFLTLSPRFFKLLKFKFTPKDVSDFFLNAVRETMDYREQNKIKRNDFMELLIQLKNRGRLEDVDGVIPSISDAGDPPAQDMKFTFNEAAAQAFVFFLAGFETSSTTLTFALYELSLNTHVQDRLQKEIDENIKKCDNKITYDRIIEMEYLDQVIQETLRKHPPVPFLMRECNKDYHIPELKVTIPSRTLIMISCFAIQRDPENFPEPENFDPDRFLPEEKAKRHNCTSMPFGEGPRNCIGSRFGLLQSKIGLVSILSKYDVRVSDETPIPLVYDKMSFVLSPKGGIPLKLIPRNKYH